MNFFETVQSACIDQSALFPYAGLVPKGVEANLLWREWASKCGEEDELDRQAIFDACKRDLLFFINGFLWIKQESPVPDDLPFITWPKQDEYVRLLCETRRAVEADKTGDVRGDVLTEKCREVGWSWLSLAEDLHVARFTSGATVLIGSRVEYDVDKRGSSKSLFWKLDYYIEHLPQWFMPDVYWSKAGYPIPSARYRTKLKLSVPGVGTILGSATHENFGRSGRYYKMDLDEFAHVDRGQAGMGERIWSATTKTCRLRRAFSTPYGRGNKFATLRHSGTLPVVTVHWYDDPAKMRGAYRLDAPMEVGPVTVPAGEWWSPWSESTRVSDDNDALFAQEVLLSYEGLGGSFYDKLLPRIKHEQVREPVFSGIAKIKDGTEGPRVCSMVREAPAFLKLWEFCEDFTWPAGMYVMGIDVAGGSQNEEGRGASNSTIVIGRVEGRKVVKVGQYMAHGLFPHVFARVVCAIGWCFRWSDGRPAYAIWERNGPGESMGGVLMRDYRYSNCHWETNGSGGKSPGFQMGLHRKGDGTLVGSKVNVFNEHKAWLARGDYVEPSYDTYREMEQYQTTADGGAEHNLVMGSLDPGEGRSNHGDTVIGTVLMIWAVKALRELEGERTVEADPPKMSVAWAQKQVKREAAGVWR